MASIATQQSAAVASSIWEKRQRLVLLGGMVLDGSFGLMIALTPFFDAARALARHMSVLPDPRDLWYELVGIFLLIMAFIYWMSARDVTRYLGNVVAAIAGKAVSVPFYLYWVTFRGAPSILLVIIVADAVIGVLHLWAIGPPRAARVSAAFRKQTWT
jgi:hypothetical protein